MSNAYSSGRQVSADPPEDTAESERRRAWEASGIARARASVEAGRVVEGARVKAWIDSLGTDQELPVPYSGR